MPSRNLIKEQAPESYYHVYARGVNKQKIFWESRDYEYFIRLFERYLSNGLVKRRGHEVYPNYAKYVDLGAYCLMSNHFHMLIYQQQVPYMEKLMRSLMTSYSMYFNLKYGRTGPVFESSYKASRVTSDTYLQHITRYIHLNPRKWEAYKYSSLKFYREGNSPGFLRADKILDLFESREGYMAFVYDYEQMREVMSDLKHQLADM